MENFKNKLIVFLEDIYFSSSKTNINKINGRKNSYNSFEQYIELKCKQYFPRHFKLHPNGCQRPPDFIIYSHNREYQISIECKSSSSNIPFWNCSLPQPGWVYIHKNTKTQELTFFQAKDIMTTKEVTELKQISRKVSEFSTNVSSNWTFYPRNMFVQRSKLPQDKKFLLDNICIDLENLIKSVVINKQGEKVKEIYLRETTLCNCPKRLVRTRFGWARAKRYISCTC